MYKIWKKLGCIFILSFLLCGCTSEKMPKNNNTDMENIDEKMVSQSEEKPEEKMTPQPDGQQEETTTPQPDEKVTSQSDEQSAETSTPQPDKQSEENKKQTTDVSKKEKLHFFDEQTQKWFDAKINPNVEKHSYDWSYLENTKKDISYADGIYEIRKGVDVSHHQGTVDWKKVKADGYDFAILRIGYRGYGQSGGLYVDKEFKNNLKNAHKAGLDVGAYMFSQAINEEEALEEAELVLEQLKGEHLELPVIYDPELIRTDKARTDNISGEQFTKNTIVFLEKIKKAGYEPMIYSNMYWESFLFDLEKLSNYPIWYADYEKIPQTPYQFEFWQYTNEGTVDGISGKTDLNIQFLVKE